MYILLDFLAHKNENFIMDTHSSNKIESLRENKQNTVSIMR